MPPLIILFTRYPRPGQSKTRLIPALGRHGAAAWQREMTVRTVSRAREAAERSGARVWICFKGADQALMRAWLGRGPEYLPQSGADLGERMAAAFEAAFGQGCEKAVLLGSDIPGLAPEIMVRALDLLEDRDLVLGPARDGGYYLIGLKRPFPELFRGVDWSTGKVLAQTLERPRGSRLEEPRP